MFRLFSKFLHKEEESMKALYTSIVALFILSAVALTGTFYFYTQVEVERKARSQAEKGTSELERMVQEKEKAIEEKSQSGKVLEAQVDELKAEIRTKNQELTKNRTEIAQSQSKIQDLSEKIRLLEKENKELATKQESAQTATQLSDASATVADPVQGIETGGTASSKAPAQPSKTDGKGKLSGKVILVNREYHFIVTGIGKLDGVNPKDQMEIVRGDQIIGKATVSKLYDSLSSCEILQEDKSPIQEGDLVRIVGRG